MFGPIQPGVRNDILTSDFIIMLGWILLLVITPVDNVIGAQPRWRHGL